MEPIKTISVDIETYSSVDLGKSGVYRYAESEDFEILLFGYSVNGGPVQVADLACGEAVPSEIITALLDDAVLKWAFNAQFERICLSRHLGLPTGKYLDPVSWHCTMIWSATLGLPMSLAGVGTVLGLEKQKLTEGKDLIRYFCVPCKPTKANGGRTRNLPEHDRGKWEQFKAYNLRDVETEMEIQKKLSKFPVPESEWQNYHLDQQINDRGVALDMVLAHRAVRCDEQFRELYLQQARDTTGLENPNSVLQLRDWLREHGVELDSLSKNAVQDLLPDTDGDVKKVLSLRQELSKSSVKKYTAMENVACRDFRGRGLIQFYGASRTGRYSGKLLQIQNLPQNHLPDLEVARSLVRTGNFDALELLYDSVPNVLSELIRTAIVPREGCRFIVSDYSAIEARVLSWFAGEKWRLDTFVQGGDIYCASASQMFGVPVEKHGVNGDLRQKGKQAELACIAEGQLVLTDHGLVPIEKVTPSHLLWDGCSWVAHEGVVCNGEREVLEYDGLIATADHLVWIEGKSEPIPFGIAAACGAHLIQTGDGRRAIRMGENYQPGETLEQGNEPLLCADRVPGVREHPVAEPEQSHKREVKGLPELFAAEADSQMAGQTINSSKAAVRKSQRSRIRQLWRAGHKVFVSKCDSGGAVSDKEVWPSTQADGNRPHQQQSGLCSGQFAVCDSCREQQEQTGYGADKVRTGVLAVLLHRCDSQTVPGTKPGGDYPGCRNCSVREKEKLAAHPRKVRVYDIRNAGGHHRFTVSGRLVHNCGYGGSVGAMKSMGAVRMGVKEEELKPLVDAWRQSNPKIVQFWWEVDRAAKMCVKQRITTQAGRIRFEYQSGILFATLPSGRRLAYAKPRMGENKFGSEAITYEGVGTSRKWMRLETYGPKLVENIVQGTARDLLALAMLRLDAAGYSVVMHCHDEAICEVPIGQGSVEEVNRIMAIAPDWAEGLPLRADGYECEFYKKD